MLPPLQPNPATRLSISLIDAVHPRTSPDTAGRYTTDTAQPTYVIVSPYRRGLPSGSTQDAAAASSAPASCAWPLSPSLTSAVGNWLVLLYGENFADGYDVSNRCDASEDIPITYRLSFDYLR